jgi:hypothetical protein
MKPVLSTRTNWEELLSSLEFAYNDTKRLSN